MGIKALKTGYIDRPKIMGYGGPGTGKSTLFMGAPDCLWITAEEGEKRVTGGSDSSSVWTFDDAGRTVPQSWEEILGAVTALAKASPTGIRFLGVDGLTRVQELAEAHLCRTNNKKGLADFPYGKGYSALHNLMTEFRFQLDTANQKGLGILLVAHAQTLKLPALTAEDQSSIWHPKLQTQDKADVAGMFVEWCDAVLFIQADTKVATVGEGSKKHAFTMFEGGRVARTRATKDACHFTAKCWSHVDATVPLHVNAKDSWNAIWSQIEGGANPAQLDADIEHLLALVPEDIQKQARTLISKPEAKEPANKVKLRTWLSSKVEIKNEQ